MFQPRCNHALLIVPLGTDVVIFVTSVRKHSRQDNQGGEDEHHAAGYPHDGAAEHLVFHRREAPDARN